VFAGGNQRHNKRSLIGSLFMLSTETQITLSVLSSLRESTKYSLDLGLRVIAKVSADGAERPFKPRNVYANEIR